MSKGNEIARTTSHIIYTLWNNGYPDKAALAGLRNSKTVTSKQAFQAWPVLFQSIQPENLSHTGNPTRTEIAIFTAVKAYASYQQGNSQLVASQKGFTFMEALKKLRLAQPETTDALNRRVERLLSTRSLESFLHQLQGLISILKSRLNGQPIDFGTLAQDIYLYQTKTGTYNGNQAIILRWGQDYYTA